MTMTMQTIVMTGKASLPPPLPPPMALTSEMTTTMMPATMMGRRGRKSVRRYKRKDNFGNCGEGESVFDGDCLKPKKFIPNLPYVASRANKRQHTIPYAYWE